MYVKKYILLIITIVMLIVIACNPPDNGNNTNEIIEENIDDDDDDEITEKITNLKVSLLESKESIYLSWENPGVDSYKVYRYTSLAEDAVAIVFEVENTFFEDLTALSDTLYFYAVSCIKDLTEYELSQKVAGLYCNEVDHYEPDNNDISFLDPEALTFPILNQEKEALIFSCPNGSANQLENDTDWYKYKGLNKTIFFEIALFDDTTAFGDGDLRYRYYFNEEYGPEHQYQKGKHNCITFSQALTGDIEVFFKVYINCEYHNNNIIEKYKIKISDNF